MNNRKFLLFFFLAAVSPVAVAAQEPVSPKPPAVAEAPADPIVTVSGHAMGTGIVLKLYTDKGNRSQAQAAAELAMAEMARIESLMSEWIDSSEISRINQAAGTGVPQTVSAETVEVLQKGKAVNMSTGGAFAMSWRPLSGLWNFSADVAETMRQVPDEKAALEMTALVDDSQLLIDAPSKSVALRKAGMALGLGGIAKGYAIDRAMTILTEQGYKDALVFAGGDIRVAGKRGEASWLVGLQDPRASEHFALLYLRDEAIATSGDYERYFERDGKRYHHILDPKTGMPASGCRGVTVVTKYAVDADATATAVFVMGPQQGMQWIEQQPGMEAIIVDSASKVTLSTGLGSRVRILRPPTS